MSFFVTLTSDPYPAPLAAKSPAPGDRRPAREGGRHQHASHPHGQSAPTDEEPLAERALSTSSPLVGRLINVRV